MLQANLENAPGGYGTHFKESPPFTEFAPPTKAFFNLMNELPNRNISVLDAAGGNGKRFPNGLIFLSTQQKVIDYTITDLMEEDLITFQNEVAPNLPLNICSHTQQMDLSKTWKFENEVFDASIMSFALHWLGASHQQGIKEMIRTLKHDGIGYISTLAPYDLAIVNQTFPQQFPIERLKHIYPNADSITQGVSKKGEPIWNVRLDESISRRLELNPDYVLIRKHPRSIIGKKQVVGFQPEYLKKILEKEGCDVLLEAQERNLIFPNGYEDDIRSKSYLYYIFKKR